MELWSSGVRKAWRFEGISWGGGGCFRREKGDWESQ